MAFVGTKIIGHQKMEFKADGSVVYVTEGVCPVNDPEQATVRQPEPQDEPVDDQKPKRRRGRPKKASAE